MIDSSARHSPGRFGALHTLLNRRRLRPVVSRLPYRRWRFQPRLEALEARTLLANGLVPTPAHVVVVVEENHGYSEIIGSSQAPYINTLAQQGALMTNSFAIEHPSQPDYLDIFSGSNQGVTDSSLPIGPFSTPNLASELIAAGRTFGGYSEDLPFVGDTDFYPNRYDRNHNPWVDFSNVPASANMPFAGYFPSDFSQLPTVSFVVPNLDNDMHDGTIQQGDQWLKTNIDAYAQWAKANNSLLIVTWDEDEGTSINHIATLFVGPMVKPGQYSETVNHFNVLRTLEDMYGLPYAGASASASPITDIWAAPAAVVASPISFPAVEGTALSNQAVATFTDPAGAEPTGNYTATISWGDSTPATTGMITVSGAVFTVSGSHAYGEEGTYTVTTAISREGSTPQVVYGNFGPNMTFDTDPFHGWRIKGQQAIAQQFTPAGNYAFTGAQVALVLFGGPDSVEVFLQADSNGLPGAVTEEIPISGLGSTPAILTASSALLPILQEGTPYWLTLVAGADGVLAGWNWNSIGDASADTFASTQGGGPAGPWATGFLSTRSAFEIDGLARSEVQSTATVSDPAVSLQSVPVFGVVCNKPSTTLVATFTDPGGPEPNASDPDPNISHHYTASIDWGDLTPAAEGMITLDDSGVFTVSGSHAYAKEGTYTITTTINHEGVITTATSTATIKDDLGLLLLDPTGGKSLMVTGNGNVTATGCGAVVVDSNDSSGAAFLSGHGTVTAFDIDITGGVKTAGHGSFSGPVELEAATADPLGLALPAPPAPTFAAVHYSGSASSTLSPGTYVGGIEITGKGSVTLLPGVYFMKGGGFSVTGQGSVSGTGVVIINAPGGPSDTIRITGQGSVTLTAPADGPFQGIVMFQDPKSSNTVQFSGKGAVTLTGVVYVPDAPVSITGNGNVVINHGPGTATLPPILGALIAYDLKVDGNGVLTINPDNDPPGGAAALPQDSLLLSKSQQADGNSQSSAPVTRSGASTIGAQQTALDQLFSSNSGAKGAALSGGSKGVQLGRSIATWLDPLSGQLVNELVSSLVQVA